MAAPALGAPPPAGSLREESPTRGIELPTRPMAGDPDAAMIETAAASLAFLQGPMLELVHVELDEGSRGGAGDALFFAQGQQRWGLHFGTGFGLQFLKPPAAFDFDGDATTRETAVKLSYGLAFGAGPAAIGFSGEHFFADHDKRLDGFDSLSLSAASRPFRWLSVGVAVHDVLGQRANFVDVRQSVDGELAVRPLGHGSFEVAAGARWDERTDLVDPRVRVQLAPVAGVVLRVGAELAQRFLPTATDPSPASRTTDVRLVAGIELDLERWGVGFSGFASTAGASGRPLGFATVLRASAERFPALWVPPRRVVRVVPVRPRDEHGTVALLLRLEALGEDPRVSAVLLDLSRFDAPLATMEELRGAIGRLRQAGKKTLAFLGNAPTRLYFLAAACDRVVLDPAADLDLSGVAAEQLYWKLLLDRAGIRAEFVQVGEFKSAPEALQRERPSEPAREMTEGLVRGLGAELARVLSGDRKVDGARAATLLSGGPYAAPDALRAGLVDATLRRDELDGALAGLLGGPVQLEEEPLPPRRPGAFSRPRVAVVLVEGNIVDEEPEAARVTGGFVTAHVLVDLLDDLAADPRVRAVVLRVASPGGAVLASDRIARAVERLRQRKPIVASFSEVAASGGYYVAAPASAIFTPRTALTGSIGIFGGKLEVSRLLDALGIHVETFGQRSRSLLGSLFRGYDDEQRAALHRLLSSHYATFIDVVARGRHLAPERVEALARGRVWLGAEAAENGLADRAGGLLDAIGDAVRRAHLERDDVEVEVLPEPRNVRELKQLIADEAFGRTLAALPGPLRAALVSMAPLWSDGTQVLARMPFELVVR